MGAQSVPIPASFWISPKRSLISRPFLPFASSFFNNNNHNQQYLSFTVEIRKRNKTAKAAQKNAVGFDAATHEAERLSRDAKARQAMAEEEASLKELQDGSDPKSWKWIIRKRVWDCMEAQEIAQFPRPVHHRIPNFVGANIAASKVSSSYLTHPKS